MYSSAGFSFFFLIIFFFSQFVPAQTQNLQVIPSDNLQFDLKFQKSFYNFNGIEENILSGLYDINVSVPISDKLSISGNISYSSLVYEVDYGFYKMNRDNSGLGNLFIGLQTRPVNDEGNSYFTAGFYLPTAEEGVLNYFSDYYHLQKFIPSSLSVYMNYAYHKRMSELSLISIEAGPDIMIPTGEGGNDTEFFFHYGGSAGVQIKKFLLNVELTGIAVLSEDTDDFGDRFINQIGFGAHWKEDLFAAKIFYRIFLRDELSEMVDGILGIGIFVAVD